MKLGRRSKNLFSTEARKPFVSIRLTKAVCLDCEMVGIGDMGMENMVARVSIVNQLGQCLYDKYVQPVEPVVDYRTAVSGITPENLQDGEGQLVERWTTTFSSLRLLLATPLSVVQKEVSDIIEGRILVGHAIHNDLQVKPFPLHPFVFDFVRSHKGFVPQPSETFDPRHAAIPRLSFVVQRRFAFVEISRRSRSRPGNSNGCS